MLNGFTYRGKHSSGFGLTLVSHRINFPDIREYEDEIAGLAGAIDYGTELGKREIEIRVSFVATAAEPFHLRASKIMAWLNPVPGAAALFFDESAELTYFAKYSGKLGIERIMQYGEFVITMKCTDPYAYGPEQIYETTITTSPYVFSVESSGSEPSPPMIVLTNTGATTIGSLTIKNEYQIE